MNIDMQPPKLFTNYQDWIKMLKGYKKITQSEDKSWKYFFSLIKQEEFIKQISTIRDQLDIPINGFPINYNRNKSFLPKHSDAIWKIASQLALKSKLDTFHWAGYFIDFITFNGLIAEINGLNSTLVQVMSPENVIGVSKFDDFLENIRQNYPVLMLVSKYASERDIIQFVKDNYKSQIASLIPEIKSDKNKLHPGSVRTRNNEAINDYIYQNRDLPRKKIKQMVESKFSKNLDYSSIGKIVSLEIKRRKQV